jgi:hypothetical protein
VSDSNLKKIIEMGFKIDEKFIRDLDNEIKIVSEKNYLTNEEIKTIEPIMMYKAADMAIVDEKDNIITPDILFGLKKWCGRFFILICLRSSILKNPDITAAVLTSQDAHLLNIVGINQNSQLSKISTDEINERITDHIIKINPQFKLDTKDEENLHKRIQIWKEEAMILDNFQQKK